MAYEQIKTREQLVAVVDNEFFEHEYRLMELRISFQEEMENLYNHAVRAGILKEGESFASIREAARKREREERIAVS